MSLPRPVLVAAVRRRAALEVTAEPGRREGPVRPGWAAVEEMAEWAVASQARVVKVEWAVAIQEARVVPAV